VLHQKEGPVPSVHIRVAGSSTSSSDCRWRIVAVNGEVVYAQLTRGGDRSKVFTRLLNQSRGTFGTSSPFKWRHYPGDITIWCARWHLTATFMERRSPSELLSLVTD
jgi:hypothetical protein